MAAGNAPTSEGGLGVGPSEEPVREDNRAMVQPGIPTVFNRNERWEHEARGEYFKVSAKIDDALTLALDLHRGRSLQAGNVSDYPAICPFLVAFLWFFAHAFPIAAAEADVVR